MKTLCSLLALVLAFPVFGQGTVSPEVQSDGRVIFRLKAPKAREVEVRCEGLSQPGKMELGDQGVWSFTTAPLEPDIFVYNYFVDGVEMMDPVNPYMKYNLMVRNSQVHVPGPKTLPWEENDVPHGVVHKHFYHSAIAGEDRDYYVYTPPGYDAASRKKYPALYLLHGFSDDASAWSTVGCANVILDNLIAQGKATPMIIVMPLGYGKKSILVPQRGVDARARDEARSRDLEEFRGELLKEIIPMAEKEYRIQSDRSSRAIAGLSMGGNEAFVVGLSELDKFAWICGFSSGGRQLDFARQYPDLDEKSNKQIRLLWIGCGQQDGLMKNNKRFEEWLTEKNVKHVWREIPGQHSYRVWRRNLAEVATLLFQNKK